MPATPPPVPWQGSPLLWCLSSWRIVALAGGGRGEGWEGTRVRTVEGGGTEEGVGGRNGRGRGLG